MGIANVSRQKRRKSRIKNRQQKIRFNTGFSAGLLLGMLVYMKNLVAVKGDRLKFGL